MGVRIKGKDNRTEQCYDTEVNSAEGEGGGSLHPRENMLTGKREGRGGGGMKR
jgi:hypothetical protein